MSFLFESSEVIKSCSKKSAKAPVTILNRSIIYVPLLLLLLKASESESTVGQMFLVLKTPDIRKCYV